MRRITRVVFLFALSLALSVATASTPWPDPALSNAEIKPRAARSLLLDATVLDSGRVLAVGERGHVVWSEDHGVNWQQAQVPTRATLTAIAAQGDVVIAAGHDGVIVRSTDAGASWQRVRESVFEPGGFDPTAGAPVLDLLFLDEQRVLAVGAYSLLLRSDDAGSTWQQASVFDSATDTDALDEDDALDEEPEQRGDPLLFDQDELLLDDEEDPHLNAITRLDDGRLFIVAERGSAFVSDDEGATWQRRSLPYEGSMFGILALDDSRLLAYGLRGNALLSRDRGETWRTLSTGTDLSLFGATLGGTGVALVGSNGLLLRADRNLRVFGEQHLAGVGTLAAAVQTTDGHLLLFGEDGIQRVAAVAGAQP